MTPTTKATQRDSANDGSDSHPGGSRLQCGRKHTLNAGTIVLTLLAVVFLAQITEAQRAANEPSLTQRDILLLNNLVQKQHPAPHRAVSKVGQDSRFRFLAGKTRVWKRSRTLVEVMKSLADLECVNTGFDLEKAGLPRLPLRLRAFAEGVIITQSVQGHSDLLGGTVLGLDGTNIDTVLKTLRLLLPMPSPDQVAALLTYPSLLEGTGLTACPKRCTLRIRTPEKKIIRRIFTHKDWTKAEPPLSYRPLQLAESQLSGPGTALSNYRMQTLADRETLAIDYRRAIDKSGGPTMEAFARRLAEKLAVGETERVILDLRFHQEGSSALNQPLIEALSDSHCGQNAGSLVVLIGPNTSGSGLHCAFALEQATRAVFVGSRTRHGPTFFADEGLFDLPDSGLTVRIASTKWRLSPETWYRRHLEPDIDVKTSLADLLAGRDPVHLAAREFNLGDHPDLKARISRRYSPENAIQYQGREPVIEPAVSKSVLPL